MHNEIKLCFFAHAGSSARSYSSFKKFLDPSIKPVPIEIAGRGSRLSEPRFTDAVKCAGDVFIKNKEIFEEGNRIYAGEDINQWRKCTTGKFETLAFNGDHFYFNVPVNKEQLCDYINRTLLEL